MPTGSRILGTVRLLTFLLMVLLVGGIQAIILAVPSLRRAHEHRIPLMFHKLACKVFGIEIELHGKPVETKPLLFVSNHTSYLDIPVLGSLIPGSFVAKAEVASWPLFGTLARLQRTVFIERNRRDLDNQRRNMADRVTDGTDLILFPEGTSSDSLGVLPFKSALFSVADLAAGNGEGDTQLTIQPIAVLCTHLDNLPLGRDMRHVYAWYGDMDLMPHLWRLACLGHCTVTVAFLKPIKVAGASRKDMAKQAEDAVRGAIDQINGGLPLDGLAGVPERTPDPSPEALAA
ncbi:MAG: 1-acyl-sn-glycerol-3-phosphate acyltransferase [Alphaproteobacteria bacterium]|nr:1-acyl-sn-glycerol-3-phosphate acyltransferase [Alphaproteobacteria bacterium SS10]